MGPNPISYLSIGSIPVGPGSHSVVYALSGSISSFKIVGRELTAAEIKSEADKVLPYKSGLHNEILQNSIITEGFTAFTQRNIDPFDDTRDERISYQQLLISLQMFLECPRSNQSLIL